MIDIRDIHIMRQDNSCLLFHYPSYSLLEITKNVYEIIEKMNNGLTLDQIAMSYDNSITMLNDFFVKLESAFSKNVIKKNIYDEDNRMIDRITLHVTNDCNLRCRYCYANGGNYKISRDLMTIETADFFVDFCKENFDDIRSIVFFGGEPLMNIDVIEYICEKVSKYEQQGKINFLPQFGLITNGTILNEHIISLINKYISFITVSIDGPKHINDYNRIFINGRGSYDKINKFIDAVKNKTMADIKYEATYTEYHSKEQITYGELKNFFKKHFHLDGTIVDELHFNSNNHDEFWTMIQKDFPSEVDFSDLPEGFRSILFSIVNKVPKEMCQIYRKIFAISTQGYIYPCHMDVGSEKFKLGNIIGDNIFNNHQNYKDEYPLLFNIHKKEYLCKDCWAQNICAGCTRLWFYDERASAYDLRPNKKLCQSNKKHIEKTLFSIAKIRKDPEMWSLFLNKVNNNII